MGAISKGFVATQEARGGKASTAWQMSAVARATCRQRLLSDQRAVFAQASLTVRSLVERGKRGLLLALACFCWAAPVHSGVVARIKPQSIVVCPGKRVTWECIADADRDCPEPQRIVMIAPELGDTPVEVGGDPSPVLPPQKPGDPPPEGPNDPPYPYPPQPPMPPKPPGDPGKPWPPGYPPGDPPGDCENPEVSRLTYTWKIERREGDRWVTERGPEEGGARWPEGGFLFTAAHAGKRFRISCTVRAYGRLSDGTEVACGEATAYAFARVKRDDELAVSLEAAPEPAGVWQTITLTAKLDLCDGENAPTPPFTYRWTFGDDPNKVVERQRDDTADTVHYFYKQLYRYLVRVEVTDSDGRRGSASMWVHVGLAVRLGSPMSMYVPLREYIREGENKGLADPSWTPEQIEHESYLVSSAPVRAHIVSVAAAGQKLPFEYEHHKDRQSVRVNYPRVDPLWGEMELLPVLQQAGVSVGMGTVNVVDRTSGTQNDWRPAGIWWVPNNTYLWPLNRNVSSTSTKAYWWNYWAETPFAFAASLHKFLASAKLGWMESWDIATVTTLSASVQMHSGDDEHAREGLVWAPRQNPCTGQQAILLAGGTIDSDTGRFLHARLVAAQVAVVHPWKQSGDVWQRGVAQGHRQRVQVGVVQSVEQFSEGRFEYGNGGALRYYLPHPRQGFNIEGNEQTQIEQIVQALDQGTVHDQLRQAFRNNGYLLSNQARVMVVRPGSEWRIVDGQRTFILRLESGALRVSILEGEWVEPPLLDTANCPQDQITHAWYAERGNPMDVDRQGVSYKSYMTLTDRGVLDMGNSWALNIGYRDAPAFVVPPFSYWRGNFSILTDQRNTPTLYFYSAIAARTYFFPFSYVPIHQLPGWSINFNGNPSWDLTSGRGTWRGTGAMSWSSTLQQPETVFGPYNNKIQYEVR